MGGTLAVVTAARQVGVLQAVAVSPTPFQTAFASIGMTDTDITQLPSNDIISLCDPYDCGLTSVFVPNAHMGSQACVFLDAAEPPVCERLGGKPYTDDSFIKQA